MKPVLFADDPSFWFETLRTLGHAAYGGADIGEVLTTAAAITRRRLRQLARRMAGHRRPGQRRGREDAGRRTSDQRPRRADAGQQLLPRRRVLPARRPRRSSYRPCLPAVAGVLCDRRARSSILRSSPSKSLMREQFCTATSIPRDRKRRRATPNDDHAQRIRRHVRGDALVRRRRRPGTRLPRPDLRRPGQPARRLDGLVFRPDWENVITPVLDWLVERPGVDPAGSGFWVHRWAACWRRGRPRSNTGWRPVSRSTASTTSA